MYLTSFSTSLNALSHCFRVPSSFRSASPVNNQPSADPGSRLGRGPASPLGQAHHISPSLIAAATAWVLVTASSFCIAVFR